MESFCEQCHNLVSGVYKTSCKTGQGVEDMFRDIANQLAEANRYVKPKKRCLNFFPKSYLELLSAS